MTESAVRACDLTVIGVGNLLWADEGFGVRCAEHFHEMFRPVPRGRVLDGGTLGLWLLDAFSTTRDLLIFDCADLHEPPGSLKVLPGEDLELWTATKISPHQAGVNDVLASAVLLGRSPDRIAVIAVQPLVLEDYGGSLSPLVRAAVRPAIEAARLVLEGWGYGLELRAPGEPVPPFTEACLDEGSYEAGRPSEAAACRAGDPRFASSAA